MQKIISKSPKYHININIEKYNGKLMFSVPTFNKMLSLLHYYFESCNKNSSNVIKSQHCCCAKEN